MPRTKQYDVALSFAGEDRSYVEQVAAALRVCGIRVFYDLYEEASLWGKDLYVHLRDVYQRDAAFTVMFISSAYAAKLWTSHERQSAQARALSEHREYILPARFDDTEVPGLPSTVGYVDLRKKSPSALCELIVEKLQSVAVFTDFMPPRHKLLDEHTRFQPKEEAVFSATLYENGQYRSPRIAINPSRYRSVGELLDELYSHYLSTYLPPFTYGEQWLIMGEPFGKRLLVPWQWVLGPSKPIHKLAPEWNATLLPDVGIVQGTHWEITVTKNVPGMTWRSPPSRSYLFATDDERLWSLVLSNAKAIAEICAEDFIQRIELNVSAATCCRYRGVFEDWLGVPCGCALLHTGAAPPEEYFARFRY